MNKLSSTSLHCPSCGNKTEFTCTFTVCYSARLRSLRPVRAQGGMQLTLTPHYTRTAHSASCMPLLRCRKCGESISIPYPVTMPSFSANSIPAWAK